MKRVFAGTFEAKVKALLVLREKAFFPTRVVFLRRLFEGAQPFQMVPREHFYAANSRRDVEIMSNFTLNNQTNINSLNTEGSEAEQLIVYLEVELKFSSLTFPELSGLKAREIYRCFFDVQDKTRAQRFWMSQQNLAKPKI